MAISIGIIGAAGFAGSELLRLMITHPHFETKIITSDSLAGTALAEVNPSLVGLSNLRFSKHNDPALRECDAVFLAVPHTAALESVPSLLESGVNVFDLSADYRLKDPETYRTWYGVEHSSPELLSQAVFGLPELFHKELERAGARLFEGEAILVACAGCYPTASTLAAYPAVDAGLVETPVIIDAISGVTGAGKKTNERTHFCFANENVEAYSLATHRHTPEIEQILDIPDQVVFSPHLAPFNRGILATVYLPLKEDAALSYTLDKFHALYRDFYQGSFFVDVLPLGNLPRTSSVRGTNRVHIGLALQEKTHTLMVVSAIDNLCKGAAGQAIQCANIAFGLPEEAGLEAPACLV